MRDAPEKPMERDDRAVPLTRAQLDIWLDQETGHSGTEWQVGLLVHIEGAIDRDALEWAITRVMKEAEPLRVACFSRCRSTTRRSKSTSTTCVTPAIPSAKPGRERYRFSERQCRSLVRCSSTHCSKPGLMSSTCSGVSITSSWTPLELVW